MFPETEPKVDWAEPQWTLGALDPKSWTLGTKVVGVCWKLGEEVFWEEFFWEEVYLVCGKIWKTQNVGKA